MKPIFRVWDIKNKDMSYERSLYDSKVYIDFGGDNLFYDEINEDHHIVMFATGLTDKNGKNIFDGDIVRFYGQSWLDSLSNEPMKEFVASICWNEEELCWGLKHINGDWTNNLTHSGDDGQFEVIGNIYQNPELLED